MGNIVAPTIVLFMLGGRVGGGRKKYNVKLPDMQAIASKAGPTEDQARAFNCLQRGHHNPLETISCFRFCSVVAGTVYPFPTAVAGLVWCVSRWGWALAYDGKGGRYTGGIKIGGLHWFSFLYVLFTSGYVGYTWI